ncbi:hypothetical protein FRC03_009274 [Tulasnella sp. 419]|nr:hypothetical protein FRC03_009274 [Tulasnella sp. 419]
MLENRRSLINALLGRKAIAKTSGTPGRTRTLDFYGVGSLGVGLGKHRLLIVDSPGYGVRGRPSWGDTFVKYVTQRDRLKRVYVCINAGHKVSDYDISMLQQLQEHCLASSRRGGQPLTFQTVFTKSDKFPLADADKVIAAMVDQIFKAAPLCLPPAAFTSPKVVTDTTGKKMGIEELRLSIAEACGLS